MNFLVNCYERYHPFFPFCGNSPTNRYNFTPAYYVAALGTLANSMDIFSVRNICGTTVPVHLYAIFWEIWVIMNCAAAGEAALVLNDIFSQVFFLLRIKCFLIIPIKKLLSAYVILPPLKKIASNVNSSHIHTCFAVKEFGGKL